MTEVLNSNSSLSSVGEIEESHNDSKNRAFHKAFRKKGIPKDEIVIERYSCALQRDILLLQGFLYVTRNYVCYYSNVVGFIHQVVIPLSKVKSISKKNAALVVPNAIQIDTKTGESYFLFSFINRDSVYSQLISLWGDYKITHRTSLRIKIPLGESNEKNRKDESRQAKSATYTKSDLHNSLDGEKLKTIKFEDMKGDEDNINTNNTNTNANTNSNNDANSNKNTHKNNSEEDEESKRMKLIKYKRANSTPNFDPRGTRVGLKRFNHKKYSSFRKYHHSTNSRNNTEDFMEDDEKVQNDIIFPNYIPKVNSMEEYKFIRYFLLSTIIIMVLVMLLGVKLQIRIGYLSKEIKTIQKDSIYNFDSLSSSSPLTPTEDPEKIKKIVKDKETYEKLKKLSETLGLTIPQLLYTNWDEYELI